MSFLEHLDELRKRLIRSILFVVIASGVCWFLSKPIYNFLAKPVQTAMAEAQSRAVNLEGLTGQEVILTNGSLKEGDVGQYVFRQTARFGAGTVPSGVSVLARVAKDNQGRIGLFTEEPLYAGDSVIPKGVRLPFDFNARANSLPDPNGQLIVDTAGGVFSLYVKVSLYAALFFSIPFLLWQIWAFVSPGLYPHERGYAIPFVLLSSISFILGAIFAYRIIFPPAARYLLGLGPDFRLLLKADDYFDFIILIMLAMGLVFQMPAITYVLARIGLVSAAYLVRIWRTSVVVILVVAAIFSPTADVPNMLLFAAPMLVLYVVSIFVAWVFGRKRTVS
ncbi:MAG: sec-independent protein translocase protein TatC [Blastocatellia bacterium]|nr:sec-independent protein translocase protein TatC [Blastocatellia bacterium]